jgi:protein-L-isoaspartate(D-aspartate) O-methyltransferase
MDHFETFRQQMVLSQLKPYNIHDEKVLEAFNSIPRHLFVLPEQQSYAYRDGLLFLTKTDYLLSPAILASFLQQASVHKGKRVLLLNSNSGYTAALFMHLGAQVDIYEENNLFIEQSRHVFQELSLVSYRFLSANPLKEKGSNHPYHTIFIAGGIETLPSFIDNHLEEGGQFLAILCKGQVGEALCLKRSGGKLQSTILFETVAPCLPGFEKIEKVEL